MIADENKVLFNGKPASVIRVVNSPFSTNPINKNLWAKVPFNAGTGNITISVKNGATVTGPVFTYQLPVNATMLAGDYHSGIIAAGFADGIGNKAAFSQITAVAVDRVSGNIYIGDRGNSAIRKITPAGVVTTIAGRIPGAAVNPDQYYAINPDQYYVSPMGMVLDNAGNLYFTDGNCIRKLTPSNILTIVAGGTQAGYKDGAGPTALFKYPTGITIDGIGNLYVCDAGNYVIRKIEPNGIVSTFAGSGNMGNNDGAGTAASFNAPAYITIAGGALYVTDQLNHNIRKITLSGSVSTFAGSTTGVAGKNDGKGQSASFVTPMGITADNKGNIYVADYDDNKIRKITTDGNVQTFYNTIGLEPSKLNEGNLYQPNGIDCDADGNLYIANSTRIVVKIKEITTP